MQTTQEITQKIVSEFTENFKNLPRETEDERATRLAENERREKAIRVAGLRQNWNAPLRQVLNHRQLNHSDQWESAKSKVVKHRAPGFLIALVGTRGSGKTQIAVETMFQATENEHSARYLTATEFFMAVKATYCKDASENEERCIRRFAKFDLLVIDEIAKRGETEWENRLLFELIDRRYRDMRDTIIISNQVKSDFIASIGASLADRMNESGGIIECNWMSFRQVNKSENDHRSPI